MLEKRAVTAILMAFLITMLMGYGEARAEPRIRIFDRLGEGQVRETATITIGGVTRTINLNEQTPFAYVEYYCVAPGKYPSSLRTTSYYYQQGKLVPVSGQFEFTLDCQRDEDFEVTVNPSTNSVTVGLQPRAVENQQENNEYVPSRPTKETAAVFGWDGLPPLIAWRIWVVCAITGAVFFFWLWFRKYSASGSVAESEHPEDLQWLCRVLPIVRISNYASWLNLPGFRRDEGVVLFRNEIIRFRKRRRRAIDAAYQPEGAGEMKQTKGIRIKNTFPLDSVDEVMIERPSLLGWVGVTIRSRKRSVRVMMRDHETPNLKRALQALLPGRVYTGCRIPFRPGAKRTLYLLVSSLWLPLFLVAPRFQNATIWLLAVALLFLFWFVSITAYLWLCHTPKRLRDNKTLKQANEDLSHHRPLRSRPLSLLAKLLAIAVLVAYFFLYQTDLVPFLTVDTEHTDFLAIAVYLVVGNLLQIANGLWQKDPRQLRETNTCRTIPYLRSFLDDRETSLHPESIFSFIVGLDPPYYAIRAFEGYPFYRMLRNYVRYFYNYHPVRLLKLLLGRPLDTSEQQMTSFFRRFGSFVAIGKPGERFATVGASRMYVGNDEWQDIVKDLLKDPQFVLLQPSSTAGIWWEVEQTLKTVRPNRALLCMVNYVKRQNDYETFRLRLEQFLPEGTKLPRSIGHNPLITFLGFDNHWQYYEMHLHYYSRFLWPLRFQAVNFIRTLKPFLLKLGLIDSDGVMRPSAAHKLEFVAGDSHYQESIATSRESLSEEMVGSVKFLPNQSRGV